MLLARRLLSTQDSRWGVAASGSQCTVESPLPNKEPRHVGARNHRFLMLNVAQRGSGAPRDSSLQCRSHQISGSQTSPNATRFFTQGFLKVG
jgi:hypothetical protein